jgi:hypothetical protein
MQQQGQGGAIAELRNYLGGQGGSGWTQLARTTSMAPLQTLHSRARHTTMQAA